MAVTMDQLLRIENTRGWLVEHEEGVVALRPGEPFFVTNNFAPNVSLSILI